VSTIPGPFADDLALLVFHHRGVEQAAAIAGLTPRQVRRIIRADLASCRRSAAVAGDARRREVTTTAWSPATPERQATPWPDR